MRTDRLTAALVEVLNAPTRPPALRPLARLKYPGRELQSQVNPDGTATVTLALYGWEYKHRGPRPKTPPPKRHSTPLSRTASP